MTKYGITLLSAGAGFMAGCVSLHPEVDRTAGEAVTAAKYAQTLNPGGSRITTDPGIDGRAADETMKEYVKSFRSPPPTMNVINIGGPLTGQGSQ